MSKFDSKKPNLGPSFDSTAVVHFWVSSISSSGLALLRVPVHCRPVEWKKCQARNRSMTESIYIYIYIYLYAGRLPGGPRFFKKRGGSGSTLKGGSGTAPSRTIKIGKSVATAKKAKSHKLPPPRAKSSVLQKHTPEFVHGALGRETSLTGCCPYKNRVF